MNSSLAQHAAQAAQLMKMLANDSRLAILCALGDGEKSVSALNGFVDLSQPGLSQQLAVLRHAGLVDTRRDGQTVYYSLASGKAQRVIELLHEMYCAE